MTPLQIEILLHYHCSPDDYRGGDFSAQAVKESIVKLVNDRLLERIEADRTWELTERGRAMVEFLCAVPLPVAKWVLPETPAGWNPAPDPAMWWRDKDKALGEGE